MALGIGIESGVAYQLTLPGGGADPDGCFLNGRRVSEKQLAAHWERQEKAWDKEREYRAKLQPTLPQIRFNDRDGRWSLQNNGRGHLVASLSDAASGKEVYVQSKGELEQLAAREGGHISTDFAACARTKSIKPSDDHRILDEG